MASGHVNRVNRPNIWLLRPSLQSEDSSCQPGAVHTWPKADIERLDRHHPAPNLNSIRNPICGGADYGRDAGRSAAGSGKFLLEGARS